MAGCVKLKSPYLLKKMAGGFASTRTACARSLTESRLAEIRWIELFEPNGTSSPNAWFVRVSRSFVMSAKSRHLYYRSGTTTQNKIKQFLDFDRNDTERTSGVIMRRSRSPRLLSLSLRAISL